MWTKSPGWTGPPPYRPPYTEEPVKLNTYDLFARAIEEGLNTGWHRAHKHVENPSQDQMVDNMHRAVMETLDEIILDWDSDEVKTKKG